MTMDLSDGREQQNWSRRISQPIRTSRSAVPARQRSNGARLYFRSLRAAEMAAWEFTGGDYALAGFVPSHSRARN
jgi:hypothetical protein